VNTCSACQLVVNATNATVCNWYSSKSPALYNSKCDDSLPGVVDSGLYDMVSGSCPLCAETSCLTCKAENNCKWVAVSTVFGSAFGQCLTTSATNPTGKTEIPTCPAICQVYSCSACSAISACSWFTGSSVVDDSCDLATNAKFEHPEQSVATTCGACMADRCYECNGLPGCGWYAKKLGSLILLQGCYSTTGFPSGRTLLSNSDSQCKGVPSGSSQVAISLGLLVVLALLVA